MPFFGVPLRNGIPIGLGSVAGFGISPFDPSQLFASNEPGVWYDPSDLTTLYQNSTGATAGALEAPVGAMLDKSRGLTLGAEQVTNGTFNTDLTGWSTTAPATATWNAGQVNLARNSGSSVQNLFQLLSLTVGKTYVFSITVSARSHTLSLFATGGGAAIGSAISSTGTFSFLYTWAVGNTGVYVGLGGSTTATATVDNISVQELPGAHAFQSSTSARPVLSARYNLFVNTDTLVTQDVTTAATDYTLRFEGAGSITLSGTATGTYNAGTHTIPCTAGTLTATVTGTVTNADIRVANDGVELPAYQSVGAAVPGSSTTAGTAAYDTTGFPPYLVWDGSDGMATSAIDFSGTDAVTVFAGLRKTSDSAQAAVVELTASIAANNGAFLLAAPDGANATFGWDSKGTAQVDAVASSQTAPITAVLTGSADISSDSCILRVNGAQADSDTGDQGTGNYANAVLNIGARSVTSSPTLQFSGRLYSLIVRGAATSDAQISSAETWVNEKTRAY